MCRRLDNQRVKSRLIPGAKYVEFAAEAIFERDGWICQICSEPVDRGASFPHPLSPTLDHVWPVRQGGDHTPENVRCAHLRCNQRRGGKYRGEHAMPGSVAIRLWIDGKSLGLAYIAHQSAISNQQIREINQANSQKLGGHRLDRYTLAAVECAAVHNSLTENGRSKIEEVGTASIKGLLRDMGFEEIHGTVIRIAMELLEEAGRIRCIDRSYEQRCTEEGREGRCRRYIPSGGAWALPFIENIDIEKLSPAQQRSRAAYQCQQMRKREEAAARRAIAAAPRPAPVQPPTPFLHYKGVWSSILPACASQRAPSTPCTAPSDFDAWYFEAFREELNREHCARALPERLEEDHAMVPNEFENLADFLAWAQAIAA